MSDFVLKQKNDVWYGVFPRLEALGVVHAFTCRMHGQSDITVNGLNMALHVGDDKDKVLANRHKVAAALNFDLTKATTCAQVHGTHIVSVTEKNMGSGAADFAETIGEADGLVTNMKQVPLMLFYADCVPVILIDTKGEAIAVVHAGWRGSVGDIAAKAVDIMINKYGALAENIVVTLGPSIGACCYEVDETVWKAAPKYHDCFEPTTLGHWHLNLWQVNRKQLEEKGVWANNILCANVCTSDNKELFFSYRAEKGKTGRLAAIAYKR
jgi:polyphenol oxidase